MKSPIDVLLELSEKPENKDKGLWGLFLEAIKTESEKK